MTALQQFLTKLAKNRYMIRTMAMREIRNRYVGSTIGILWSVIHPIIMVTIYWFIFSIGFKMQPSGDVPFVVWFFCAFVAWTTFSEMVMGSTHSLVANDTLIKRTLFPSEILPVIHLASSAMTHLVMLAILSVMLAFNGISFSLYNLQFLYYYSGMMLLMLGLGWLFSSINVFVRDMGQLVNVIMQVWFWATPIFWQLDMIPERLHLLLKLNPMFYVVEGYRDSFLYHRPFWDQPGRALAFWAVCLSLFVIGGAVFRRLKREFADVL